MRGKAILIGLIGCGLFGARAFAAAATVRPELAAHTEKMTPQVYHVTDRVYVALGYGLANSTMVVGDDGLVIIDVMESVEAGQAVLAEFRKITDKPIKAIIYTHNHIDHVGGVRAFVTPEQVAAGQVDIYAHETLLDNVINTASVVSPILNVRSAYFGGLFLERGDRGWVNLGIGPFFRAGTYTFLPPTRTFADRLDVTVAGVRLHLRYVPSETNDEIVVWMPDERVLQSAEVLQGESFPNLYTIRGTKHRDPVSWFKSVDVLRSFEAEHMAPSHGRPISGRAEVEETLTAYRDAIQYVHDQTVRRMNLGLTPDDLAAAVTLPPHLAAHPWLGEFYGTVKHAVRQIYVGYLGWFEGDPTFLDPVPPRERAARYVALMGGRDAILAAAREAFDAGDYRWTAEVLTYVIRLDPDDMAARALKAEALRQFGYAQTSVTWRNWALTAAEELDGALADARPVLFNAPDIVRALPARVAVEAFTVRLDAAKAADVHMTMGFAFTDTGDGYGLEIRRGVAQFHPAPPPHPDVTIRLTKTYLDDVVLGRTTLAAGLESGAIQVEGDPADVPRFFGYFDPPGRAPIRLTVR